MKSSKLWGKIAVFLIILGVCAGTALALSGSGTEEDPWLIQSLADFDDFASDANYWDDYTRLETDVNLAGRTYSTAVIAPDVNSTRTSFQGIKFTGVFEGNEHKVVNLTIHHIGHDYLGLFGYIDQDSQVNDLGLEGVSVSGYRYVGSLVGASLGDISGCHSLADVNGVGIVGGLIGGSSSRGGGSISDCYSVGDVNGYSEVGGLLGYADETEVSECYSASNVHGYRDVGGLVGENHNGSIRSSRSSGDVSGGYFITAIQAIGGLVGANYGGTISECISGGNVSGTVAVGGVLGYNDFSGTVSRCYSTGDVSGRIFVGGVVGCNEDGSIIRSYSAGKTSGVSVVGGLVGMSRGGEISNSYSIGETFGDDEVGGLIGSNCGSVSLCYCVCDVNGIGEGVGGLVGFNGCWGVVIHEGTVSQCVWDIEVQMHGVTKSVGIEIGVIEDVVAAETGQMKMRSTFVGIGWDFIGVWNIGENQTYPYLRTVPAGDINKDGIVNFLDVAILGEKWMKEE